jgi:hypothetical protein
MHRGPGWGNSPVPINWSSGGGAPQPDITLCRAGPARSTSGGPAAPAGVWCRGSEHAGAPGARPRLRPWPAWGPPDGGRRPARSRHRPGHPPAPAPPIPPNLPSAVPSALPVADPHHRSAAPDASRSPSVSSGRTGLTSPVREYSRVISRSTDSPYPAAVVVAAGTVVGAGVQSSGTERTAPAVKRRQVRAARAARSRRGRG